MRFLYPDAFYFQYFLCLHVNVKTANGFTCFPACIVPFFMSFGQKLVENERKKEKEHCLLAPNIFPFAGTIILTRRWILLLLSFHLISLHIIFSKICGEREEKRM